MRNAKIWYGAGGSLRACGRSAFLSAIALHDNVHPNSSTGLDAVSTVMQCILSSVLRGSRYNYSVQEHQRSRNLHHDTLSLL